MQFVLDVRQFLRVGNDTNNLNVLGLHFDRQHRKGLHHSNAGHWVRRQTLGAGCSPRKIAALRVANSPKLVARNPKIVWMIGETCASLPLRRSAKSSARASAVYGGTPAAS